jgi:hypothetical protein
VTTNYTFLPWARRGLAARTDPVTGPAPLPARATVTAGPTLSGPALDGSRQAVREMGCLAGTPPRPEGSRGQCDRRASG